MVVYGSIPGLGGAGVDRDRHAIHKPVPSPLGIGAATDATYSRRSTGCMGHARTKDG